MGGLSSTVGCDALERLSEQLLPVKIQGMKPRGPPFFFELLGVLMGILLLHRSEPWDAEIGQVLAETAAMLAMWRRGLHGW